MNEVDKLKVREKYLKIFGRCNFEMHVMHSHIFPLPSGSSASGVMQGRPSLDSL